MTYRRLIVAALASLSCTAPTEPREVVIPPALMAASREWADVGRRCDDFAPAVELPALLRLLQESMEEEADGNTEVARLARKVPGGFGGHLLVDGVPTIWLVRPAKRVEAVAALRELGVPIPSNPAVLRGRWDFAQMYDWYRYLNARLANVDGIWTRDIQEAANRIEYGVRDSAALSAVEHELARIGVPCRLVALHVIEWDGLR